MIAKTFGREKVSASDDYGTPGHVFPKVYYHHESMRHFMCSFHHSQTCRWLSDKLSHMIIIMFVDNFPDHYFRQHSKFGSHEWFLVKHSSQLTGYWFYFWFEIELVLTCFINAMPSFGFFMLFQKVPICFVPECILQSSTADLWHSLQMFFRPIKAWLICFSHDIIRNID